MKQKYYSSKALEIESFINESRSISKSKNNQEYLIRIPYDGFNEISNIKGSTNIAKTDKRIDLNSSSIGIFDAEYENIYKSDNKLKYICTKSGI